MRSISLIIGSMVAISSSLAASVRDEVTKLRSDVNDLKKNIEKGCDPLNKRGIGIYVFGDYLHWKATEDNLEEIAIIAHPQPRFNIGTIKDLHFHYDPGFRIGAGYRAKSNFWGLSAVWTSFHTSATVFERRQGSDTFILLYGQPGTQVQQVVVDTIKDTWKLKYDTLDGIFIPGCLTYRSFSLEPFFGVRALKLDQHLDFFITGTFTPQPGVSGPAEGAINGKLNYRAIGPLLGFTLKRDIYWGFSIAGQALSSLVYGKYRLRQPQPTDTTLPGLGFIHTLDSFAEDFHRWRANLQFALRLNWEKAFYKDRLLFGLSAAYENLIWFSQNNFIARHIEEGATATIFDIRKQNGDLGMGGFSFSAKFGF